MDRRNGLVKKCFIVLHLAVVGGIIFGFIWAARPSALTWYLIRLKPEAGRIIPDSKYVSENYSQGYYPDVYPCHYTKLIKIFHRAVGAREEANTCKPYIPDEEACRITNEYFGSPRDAPEVGKCDTTEWSDICWFGNKENHTETKLFCSSKVCKTNTISMGKRNPSDGYVREWITMEPFSTEKALKFVEKTFKEGDTFCFIKCGSILQTIVFPPQFYLKETDSSAKKINVNIVVLDSISRPHFYRMMKKSIGAFRDVIYDKSSAATALDFELFQSVGTSTFENIRALFSGIVVGNKDYGRQQVVQPVIGFNVMYEHFHKHGYQTIFQEDLCWYDRWGTLLNNIKITGTSKPTRERWSSITDTISKHHIDHFGLTFSSCEILKQYDKTNPFGDPEEVCLNGKFYSSYFLRYIKAFANGASTTENAAPFISYTHINAGHSVTGKRIRNIDGVLADYISSMAR